MASRSRQHLQSNSTRLSDASTQQRLVARAADIGKHWREFPVARKRAVLARLIERVGVSVDQIDIRLRPSRFSALLDVAATSQGVNDGETESCPCRCGCAAQDEEIRMVIDGTDPFAASKPDARLIRLLIRACRFNAALAQGEGIPFATARPPLVRPRRSLAPIIRPALHSHWSAASPRRSAR